MTDKNEIIIPSEFARLLDRDWREAIVEGGRYSLKSHTVARICLIRAMKDKTRILCGREFQNSINESVYQLLVDLIQEYNLWMFKVTRDSIINVLNGSDFLFKGVRHNQQSIKSIEGVDIFWGEEAQSFSKESIDIITPTIRKKGAQLIWTMNRLFELDPIYERIVLNNMPNTIHINANYDVAEKYGWLPNDIKIEIEFDRVNNPSLYAHKWLGQPMSQVDAAIIGRDKILKAMQREVTDDGQEVIGADIARMGNDRTVFWKRKGLKTIDRVSYNKNTIPEACDYLEKFSNFNKEIEIRVDDTGLGGGVTDEMKKRGYKIIPINFGGEPTDKDKYPNLISEAWFYFESIMDRVELPMDQDLLMELSSRQWVMDSKQKRKVESKGDYKKRGYRSPDLADACIMCYYNPQIHIVEEDDIEFM
jgi:phage terminase large subunit